ncbi:MAG: MbnP family protein [bacterium]|jgi:hypothetical protein
MKKGYIYILLIFISVFTACKKDEVEPSNNFSLKVNIDNVYGEQELVLDSMIYSNQFEQSFKVKKFNYFISNIVLVNENNEDYVVPQDESYFLIKEIDKPSHQFSINNLPLGTYTKIKFLIGVDSLRNTKSIAERIGVLDVGAYAADMYWTWNQGYIFLKLELHQSKPKGDTTNAIPYVYHIGGFGGMNTPTVNNLRTVELDLTNKIVGVKNSSSNLYLKVDAEKVIRGNYEVDLDRYPTVMLTPFSKNIADNYKNMFSVITVAN